jgi:DNA-binding NarL/FixJ family response regulator
MLVEDNKIFREAFKEQLLARCPSAIVKEAANGEEVSQGFDDSSPQMIFMDFHLRGENGFQLTKMIKGLFPNVRIAMLTNYDLPEYRQAAIRAGADRYFVKDSISWDEIMEFIECHSALLHP